MLLRWDISRPLTVDNCVVMEHGEGEKHSKAWGISNEASLVDPKVIWGDEVQGIVDRRAEEVRRERQWVM